MSTKISDINQTAAKKKKYFVKKKCKTLKKEKNFILMAVYTHADEACRCFRHIPVVKKPKYCQRDVFPSLRSGPQISLIRKIQ